MKAKNIIIAGLAGIIFAACTEDMALENMAQQRYNSSLKVEVTDGGAAPGTRANYSGFPATTFETGDAIGLYAFDDALVLAIGEEVVIPRRNALPEKTGRIGGGEFLGQQLRQQPVKKLQKRLKLL